MESIGNTLSKGSIENQNHLIVGGLSGTLADLHTMSLAAQNFHWNVKGPNFLTLHNFFENQFQFLVRKVDETAGRIRTLGFQAPATFQEFSNLRSLGDAPYGLSEEAMVRHLAENYRMVVSRLLEIEPIARSQKDIGTQDLVSSHIRDFEKAMWMLESIVT